MQSLELVRCSALTASTFASIVQHAGTLERLTLADSCRDASAARKVAFQSVKVIVQPTSFIILIQLVRKQTFHTVLSAQLTQTFCMQMCTRLCSLVLRHCFIGVPPLLQLQSLQDSCRMLTEVRLDTCDLLYDPSPVRLSDVIAVDC